MKVDTQDASIDVHPAKKGALFQARVQALMCHQSGHVTHSYKPVTIWKEFISHIFRDLAGRSKNVEVEMTD